MHVFSPGPDMETREIRQTLHTSPPPICEGEAMNAFETLPFLVIEVVGTVAFAVSGAMAAARSRMDWLGAFVLAIVVAIGGGTIRDVLMGRLPVAWLENPWPVLVAGATAVVVIIALRIRPTTDPENWTLVIIADALGLSSFVILGTAVGLEGDLTPFLAVLLGVVTGVGGGVIRDVLTNNRPMVLVGQVYAVAGLIGGALFALLTQLGVTSEISVWASVAVVFGMRMLAVRQDWHLPKAGREVTRA